MAQVGEAGLDSTKFLSQYIMHVCAAVGVKAQFLNGIGSGTCPEKAHVTAA